MTLVSRFVQYIRSLTEPPDEPCPVCESDDHTAQTVTTRYQYGIGPVWIVCPETGDTLKTDEQ